jgi:hypothetical protein
MLRGRCAAFVFTFCMSVNDVDRKYDPKSPPGTSLFPPNMYVTTVPTMLPYSQPSGAAVPTHKPLLAERFKTKLCQKYESHGHCPYEARCMFAHGHHDMRSKEMNYRDNLVTEEAIKSFMAIRYGGAATEQTRSILADRFKSKLCDKYQRLGECPFEHRCMFAHGEEDLRTTEMNLRDGLTTEEAIKAFQTERVSTMRDAERRRKRNDKKKAKVRAVKDTRKVPGAADRDEDESPMSGDPPALRRSAATAAAEHSNNASPRTPEPRSALESDDEADATSKAVPLNRLILQPVVTHCSNNHSSSVASPAGDRHNPLEVSDANLQSMNSVISANGVSMDGSPGGRARRRHNPYAPVVLNPADSYLARSADAIYLARTPTPSFHAATHATPAATPSPAIARQHSLRSLFPLATVLQQIRQRTPMSTSDSRGDGPTLETPTVPITLPPSRMALSSSQSHSVLFA